MYMCVCHVWFMYLCTNSYVVCAQVHLYMWVHTCMWKPVINVGNLYLIACHLCIPWQRLTLNLKHLGSGSVYCLGWGGQWASMSLTLPPPSSIGVYRHVSSCVAIHVGAGDLKAGSSVLMAAVSPALAFSIKSRTTTEEAVLATTLLLFNCLFM